MNNKLTPPELSALFKELTDFTEIDSRGRQYHEEGRQSPEVSGAVAISDEVRDALEEGKTYDFSDVTKSQPIPGNSKSNRDFGNLFLALMDARIERMLSRTSPQFFASLRHAEKVLADGCQVIEETPEPVITLKECWQWWLESKKKTPKTVKPDYRRGYAFMAMRWGEDFPITDVTRGKIRELLAEYASMPKGSKLPYSRQTLAENFQAAQNEDVPEDSVISDNTVKLFLNFLQSLFKYLTNTKDIFSVSPMTNIEWKGKDSTYGYYSDSECQKFEAASLSEKTPWKKWCVLIGMYSGMRASEINKALSYGIKISEKGIPYFYIEEGKTAAAKRGIPVHQKLLEYGILSVGEEAISPYSQAVTDYMVKLRENLGIPYLDEDGNRRIFHSLRHSFITKATYATPNLALVQQLVGHAKKAGITNRYIHSPDFQACADVVNGVKYS